MTTTTRTATRRTVGDFSGLPSTPWEMPACLTANEAAAYRKAHARSTAAAARKAPTAVIHGSAGAPAVGSAAHVMLARQLAGTAAAGITDRHAAAHRAGMAAVRKWIRTADGVDVAARLAAIGDTPRAPRKSRAVEVEPVTHVDIVAVEVPAYDPTAPVDPAPASVADAHVDGRPVTFGAAWTADARAAHLGRMAAVGAIVTTPEYVDCHGCGTRDYPGESHRCEPRPVESTPPADGAIGAAIIAGEAYVAAHPLPDPAVVGYVAARAARREARRAIAAALRAADIAPAGEPWLAATTAAGLAPVGGVQ